MNKVLTQKEIDELPDGTVVVFSLNGGLEEMRAMSPFIRELLRRNREKGKPIDVRLGQPTADELGDALRELHDYADYVTNSQYAKRSMNAFERAAELLERMGK